MLIYNSVTNEAEEGGIGVQGDFAHCKLTGDNWDPAIVQNWGDGSGALFL